MAQAVRKYETKVEEKVVKTTVDVPVGVTLTLSNEEGQYLRDLLGDHITGPDDGPRGALSNIWEALADLYPRTFSIKASHGEGKYAADKLYVERA